MISIKKMLEYAGAKQINKHILTEYIQHEILDSLYKQKGSESYSFIGGTAIRIVYGGRRYSEDLDFDTTTLKDFDILLEQVVQDMRDKGFTIEFRLIHKGAYHCHVKFPEILFKLGLSGYKEEKLLIKVDASEVDSLHTTPKLIDNYAIFRSINVAPANILLAKKLHTLKERNRPKGRDIYDITWLWALDQPHIEYLHELTGKDLKEVLQDLLSYIQELDLSKLSSEVELFLTNSQDKQRVLLFPDYLKQKINEL